MASPYLLLPTPFPPLPPHAPHLYQGQSHPALASHCRLGSLLGPHLLPTSRGNAPSPPHMRSPSGWLQVQAPPSSALVPEPSPPSSSAPQQVSEPLCLVELHCMHCLRGGGIILVHNSCLQLAHGVQLPTAGTWRGPRGPLPPPPLPPWRPIGPVSYTEARREAASLEGEGGESDGRRCRAVCSVETMHTVGVRKGANTT